uniref:DUF7802 domain-containing protein n=1 Tax=Clastoptera arizonana TaxID=38151 RepID=A0A1B6CE90_9HEMI
MAQEQNVEGIHFNGFKDWAVTLSPVQELWAAQPTYLIVQASFCLGGIITFIHALCSRGRFPYLWFGTIFYGLFIESLCYMFPDVDNFWHSQTPIMFLGMRLPLHIIFLYPCFLYQASIAVANLRLPSWAEPLAVGLIVVLIDIPYDIVSVKFVHWTWHDTDPNIGDRHYWVPWNSYFFHCTFSTGFTFWFHKTRQWMSTKSVYSKWDYSSFRIEFISMVLASILGPISGVGIFMIVYHPLHDLYNIHSEVTFFILFSFAVFTVWTADRLPKPYSAIPSSKLKWLLILALIVHYSTFMALVVHGDPQKEISIGLHQPLGPCNVEVPVKSIFGAKLKKYAYLCANNYNEDYFDFSCTNKPNPNKVVRWYTICGTPFINRVEYITVIGILTLLAGGVFWNLHFNLLIANANKKSNSKKIN